MTASERLEAVRCGLGLSLDELAFALGVTRRGMLEWSQGRADLPIWAVRRMAELERATDILSPIRGTAFHSGLGTRAIRDDKSLIDLVAEGVPGAEAARSLRAIFDVEARERREAERMLARRRSTGALAGANDDGPGIPSFAEDFA